MSSPDLRTHLHAFDGSERDCEPLLDLVVGAQLVSLGEASHGTHDFYEQRAEITKRLITQKGFSAVAAEADWPHAYHGGSGMTSSRRRLFLRALRATCAF